MRYTLVSADKRHVEQLKQYKLNTILEYASNISVEEKNKIINYVNESILEQVSNYKIICVDGKEVGCLFIEDYEDGILLDEIYLEEPYRNQGIGTDILNTVLKNNPIVYLWVYKLNKKAVALYQKMNFKIVKETETRYFMESR